MTDNEKANYIWNASNEGNDLDKHHKLIVDSALSGNLGQATRLVFEDLWEKYSGDENTSAQNDA